MEKTQGSLSSAPALHRTPQEPHCVPEKEFVSLGVILAVRTPQKGESEGLLIFFFFQSAQCPRVLLCPLIHPQECVTSCPAFSPHILRKFPKLWNETVGCEGLVRLSHHVHRLERLEKILLAPSPSLEDLTLSHPLRTGRICFSLLWVRDFVVSLLLPHRETDLVLGAIICCYGAAMCQGSGSCGVTPSSAPFPGISGLCWMLSSECCLCSSTKVVQFD